MKIRPKLECPQLDSRKLREWARNIEKADPKDIRDFLMAQAMAIDEINGFRDMLCRRLAFDLTYELRPVLRDGLEQTLQKLGIVSKACPGLLPHRLTTKQFAISIQRCPATVLKAIGSRRIKAEGPPYLIHPQELEHFQVDPGMALLRLKLAGEMPEITVTKSEPAPSEPPATATATETEAQQLARESRDDAIQALLERVEGYLSDLAFAGRSDLEERRMPPTRRQR
jgi:hypothetical protein